MEPYKLPLTTQELLEQMYEQKQRDIHDMFEKLFRQAVEAPEDPQ